MPKGKDKKKNQEDDLPPDRGVVRELAIGWQVVGRQVVLLVLLLLLVLALRHGSARAPPMRPLIRELR